MSHQRTHEMNITCCSICCFLFLFGVKKLSDIYPKVSRHSYFLNRILSIDNRWLIYMYILHNAYACSVEVIGVESRFGLSNSNHSRGQYLLFSTHAWWIYNSIPSSPTASVYLHHKLEYIALFVNQSRRIPNLIAKAVGKTNFSIKSYMLQQT